MKKVLRDRQDDWDERRQGTVPNVDQYPGHREGFEE